MSIKVLLSAFEPFGVDPENSSQLVLEALSNQTGLHKVLLPVSFAQAWPRLKSFIEKLKPDVVLALGQADRREKISIEKIALNLINARIQDNDKHQPLDQTIHAGEPLALHSLLPHRQLLSALNSNDIETELSYHAGTYVCNALMYDLVRWAEENKKQAGFIHLPLLVGQRVGFRSERPAPTLTLAKAVIGVQLLIRELQS